MLLLSGNSDANQIAGLTHVWANVLFFVSLCAFTTFIACIIAELKFFLWGLQKDLEKPSFNTDKLEDNYKKYRDFSQLIDELGE